ILERNDPVDTVQIPVASIEYLAALTYRNHGAEGATIGMLTGFGAGVLYARSQTRQYKTGRSLYMIPYIIPFYFAGSWIGASIGAHKGSAQWVDVPRWYWRSSRQVKQ